MPNYNGRSNMGGRGGQRGRRARPIRNRRRGLPQNMRGRGGMRSSRVGWGTHIPRELKNGVMLFEGEQSNDKSKAYICPPGSVRITSDCMVAPEETLRRQANGNPYGGV